MENITVLIIAIVIAIIWYAIDKNKKMERAHSNTQIATKVEVQKLKFFCIKDKGYHVSVWPNVEGYRNVDYIEFDIAGVSHYADTAKNHIGESTALLVAEPDNPYDPNAIRVMTSSWQLLGYVPRDMTDIIHEHTSGSTCPCFIFIGYREDDDIFYTDAYINLNLIKK